METVAGKFTTHDTSENGILLGQFANMNNTTIQNACFELKLIHKGTWMVPRGGVNQIDYILISSRYAFNIIIVRSCRGPNCDFDHFLVRAILKHRIYNAMRNIKTDTRKKWDTGKLKSPDIRTCQEELEEKLRMNKTINLIVDFEVCP